MTFSYGFYFILIAVAAVLSFFTYRDGHNKSVFIMMVLIATLLDEIAQLIILEYHLKGYGFITYSFNVFEYAMFSTYYIKSCLSNTLKRAVKLSIPFFTLFCICTFFLKYHFVKYPVLNIEVEGFLLFIIYTHLLFNLDEDGKKSIYAHPDFWISIGILIFFGGVFVYLGLYPVLLHVDTPEAVRKYHQIAYPLNLIFYNSIIIGLICLIRNKKYLIR